MYTKGRHLEQVREEILRMTHVCSSQARCSCLIRTWPLAFPSGDTAAHVCMHVSNAHASMLTMPGLGVVID